MSPEKEEILFKTFPHLFRDRNGPMTQTAFCWGFEHNDGWYDIIYKAASKIEPLIVKMIDDAIKNDDLDVLDFVPTTSQIKEKFGTLRWYMTYSVDEIDAVIEEAENESETTCELCGQLGELRGTHWYVTLCDSCWAAQEGKHGK